MTVTWGQPPVDTYASYGPEALIHTLGSLGARREPGGVFHLDTGAPWPPAPAIVRGVECGPDDSAYNRGAKYTRATIAIPAGGTAAYPLTLELYSAEAADQLAALAQRAAELLRALHAPDDETHES